MRAPEMSFQPFLLKDGRSNRSKQSPAEHTCMSDRMRQMEPSFSSSMFNVTM